MFDPKGLSAEIGGTNLRMVILAVLGFVFLGIGVLVLIRGREETRVEIISAGPEVTSAAEEEMVIDLSGAVEKPGVYKMVAGSRIEDLLVAGGGLAEDADREWIEKFLNRAAVLADGQKVYIPAVGEMEKIAETGASTSLAEVAGVSTKVNINTASKGALVDLWGIGEATAEKIIEGRPYSRIEELLERKIVRSNVWEAIKDQIDVF